MISDRTAPGSSTIGLTSAAGKADTNAAAAMKEVMIVMRMLAVEFEMCECLGDEVGEHKQEAGRLPFIEQGLWRR